MRLEEIDELTIEQGKADIEVDKAETTAKIMQQFAPPTDNSNDNGGRNGNRNSGSNSDR